MSYISFKLPRNDKKSAIESWLIANDMFDRITYEWHANILVFENEEDATAFYLRFGIDRTETTIEKMLKK